jgi:DNA repair protein RecN (Recombination protein N)
MIKQLYIKNYAIIQEASIEFDRKLNIITGETGAGKSILMGALGLILGDRADTKALHNPEEKCVVEGSFDITGYNLHSYFEREGLDEENPCIIRREIAGNGKSRAFINDTPVSLQQLKELGSQLVDIVSQNQTLELNNEHFQRQIIDAYANNAELIAAYSTVYTEWKQLKRDLTQLIDSELQARKDEDYLRFILNELVEAQLQPNELPKLEQELEVLSHAEHIQQATAQAHASISEHEQNLLDALRSIKQQLLPIAKHHQPTNKLIERLNSILIELKDIAAELNDITEQTEANPELLAITEARMQLIYQLLKKHQLQTTDELIELAKNLENKLNNIGSLQQAIENTQVHVAKLEAQLIDQAAKISKKRIAAATKMEQEVAILLAKVQMPDATINVHIHPTNSLHEYGSDEIKLLFAANKGSSLQPMNKVASGGELSRVMLCIKSLINDKVALPTIVFDEIDTGISGEAALKVSHVLKEHSKAHQVIAITHLPQIAGKADAHFYVYKRSDKRTTHTHIKPLSDAERVEEIARMLHGENPSEKVLEAAKELMG